LAAFQPRGLSPNENNESFVQNEPQNFEQEISNFDIFFQYGKRAKINEIDLPPVIDALPIAS